MATVKVKCCPIFGDLDISPPSPPSKRKVFSNSPAQGELQRGDVLVSINSKEADKLTHKDAQDCIKHGGGQIDLVVNRPPPGRTPVTVIRPNRVQAPTTPTKSQSVPCFGVDFRQHSAPQMPAYGHQPKTQRPIGGGGPEFGSAYGGAGGQGYYGQQPQYASGPSARPVGGGPMIDRVQQSLDNIVLSPQMEYSPAPFGGYTAPAQPYRAGPPPEPEEEEEFRPIAERKKAFQGAPSQSRPAVRSVRGPVSFQPSASPNFGTDYARMPAKPAPQPQPQRYRPPPVNAAGQGRQTQSWQPPANSEVDYAPGRAWEGTLKSEGLKPWERDALDAGELPDHLARQSEFDPPRPAEPRPSGRSAKPAPFNPTQSPAIDLTGGDEDQEGPRVVHLQYNSPMGMYSQANVQETLQGQTAAAAQQQPKTPVLPAALPGEKQRDWSQSDVFKMVHDQGGRPSNQGRGGGGGMPAKKTAVQVQLGRPHMDDEVGVSDF